MYVGVTQHQKQRHNQHKANSRWFKDIANITTVTYPTLREALAAETKAIAEEAPLHNGNAFAKQRIRLNRKARAEAVEWHKQFHRNGIALKDNVRETLRLACREVGGTKAWAWKFGYTPQFIASALKKGGKFPDDLAAVLGYQVVCVYPQETSIS